MAKKPKIDATDEKPVSKDAARHKKLLETIRKRVPVMIEADRENRAQAKADMEFLHVPGKQWDEAHKKRRGKRACYEFNKLAPSTRRVINDMRSNRPQGKVRATEDGDKDTADTREGLIRNIWVVGDGDNITDYAAEYQVGGGMGAWRIETAYNEDSVWDQDIRPAPIKNPFSLYGDPSASDPMKRDGKDWVLLDRISNAEYEARWPDKEKSNFDAEFDDDAEWEDEESVRVCEYWYKVPVKKEVALISVAGGEPVTVDLEKPLPPGAQIIRKRVINTHKIKMCIASGEAILAEEDWPIDIFPFVQVFGYWVIVDGKTYWYGLIRNAKDAQRSYNVSRTAAIEAVALAPQAKYWATPKQAEGHIDKWSTAHDENIPAMLYNVDTGAGGPPQRMAGADVPVALIQESQIGSADMRETTGIFGQQETDQDVQSGRAIIARQRQGEVATFNFSDNMANGVKLSWQIIDKLISAVMTNERNMRVLGADGAEKYVKVNGMQMDPATLEQVPVNDLSRGKFDITYTVGPSFATQRQEASETITQLAQSFPQVFGVAGDLLFKSLDIPYAEQLAERMRTLLPPEIQKTLQDGAKPLPPEVQAAMAQVDQMMQQVQLQGQAVQEAEANAQTEVAAASKATNDAKLAQANVKIAEANLATDVAQFKQLIAETEAKTAQQAGVQNNDMERRTMAAEVVEAVSGIELRVSELFQQYAAQLSQMQQNAQPQVVVAPSPPRPRIKHIKRENGVMVPVYEDEATVQ